MALLFAVCFLLLRDFVMILFDQLLEFFFYSRQNIKILKQECFTALVKNSQQFAIFQWTLLVDILPFEKPHPREHLIIYNIGKTYTLTHTLLAGRKEGGREEAVMMALVKTTKIVPLLLKLVKKAICILTDHHSY